MADDTGEGAEDERAIELSAIEAIYPELLFDPSDPYSAHIDVPVEPQKALPFHFPKSTDGCSVGTRAPTVEHLQEDIHHLSYLPSLKLKLLLPEGYPTRTPPHFELQSSWLPTAKLRELEREGARIWEEIGKEPVLFAYIGFLREGADDAFGLLSGNRATLDIHIYISADLKVLLLDFDLKVRRAKFEQETFECGICLEPKKGSVCHRLSLCSHVFCVECLQDFYYNCIMEGDIGSVKCLAPNCGDKPQLAFHEEEPTPPKKKRRKDRSLEPSELLQIPLEQDRVQRYIKLKRKKRLESDRTTIYCPRQWCQGPARSKKTSPLDDDFDSDDDDSKGPPEPQTYDPNEPGKLPPPSERLAICEDCSFAFCKVCKASWHGEYYTCFPRSQFELTAEERASEDYMKLHTQPCPTCDARAQKTHGCNHMICFKCDTHFCYLCGAYLEKDNPYQHYNSKDKACYMRLWELEAGDGGEIGQGFAGGAGGIVGIMEEDDDDDWGAVAEAPPPPLPPAPAPPVVAEPAPAAGQPRMRGHPPRARGGGRHHDDPALQRFLQMVQDDEEDEWDSDDMEDEAEELGDRWIG